ncbi:heavy metal-responsive transcriptional regulator [Arthrobacter cheniae]|uniref:Heavy metal-responsive transcriptional regulator n=1 Tax=Arthrobacter cheniae TaxID=1258888 RepID=A0A3A5M988_9MICC|nr:heavy metal-responsive transcriptional regulator [Arthrobacter cheniae]RJT75437.1 heavy metal-responsive transcriptional regulator [Arthrobacter cheniae]
MLIGEVSAATGVDSQTIRFYERQRLLPEPHRAANGYRTYDTAAIDRLRFIRAAQTAGLTLADIAQVLNLRDAGQAPCSHVSLVLEQKLAEVRARQQELADLAVELEQLIEISHTMDPEDCGPQDICRIISST